MQEADESVDRSEYVQSLYGQFRTPLIRFFLRRVRDQGDAEDLTQEVFSRLLASTRRQEFEDPGAFVFQVATNLLRDRGRKYAVRVSAALINIDPARVSEVTREFVEDRTPERVIQARSDVAEVVQALGELKERTRDIYLLFRLEQMKHREIAALYGISQSTVEKEIMRATLHLALRFGREFR
ncbi:MAG: sigma-70 family RNA polymerase sigma factor [Sphingomonas sp.]